MSFPRAISLAVLAGLAISGGQASVARADEPPPSAISEAGKHFQRGVTLYNEADYRAALVEFRRAYEIAPNPAVLYNIGQTYFELQNYAAALTALGRYLTEAGPTAPHRSEVEQTIDTLQGRVGKIAITTDPPGCEITVDDELVGKTPLDQPVLVSIGRRKITALRDGRPTQTRFVDIAAGDTVKLALSGGDLVSRLPPPRTSPPPPKPEGGSAITAGWYITGGLGAVALGAGVAAFFQSRSLHDARNRYPVTQDELDDKASWVTRLSLAADISGALALVAGGITLKLTLSRSRSREAHVAIAPDGIRIAGEF